MIGIGVIVVNTTRRVIVVSDSFVVGSCQLRTTRKPGKFSTKYISFSNRLFTFSEDALLLANVVYLYTQAYTKGVLQYSLECTLSNHMPHS
jgi:hypothetical protein